VSAPEDSADPVLMQAAASRIVRQLAGLTPPEGCVCLAMAYAQWVERDAEADAELLASMLEVSARTTREAFRMYRALRTVRQEMVDAALRSTD
jgi:hypothetical protein